MSGYNVSAKARAALVRAKEVVAERIDKIKEFNDCLKLCICPECGEKLNRTTTRESTTVMIMEEETWFYNYKCNYCNFTDRRNAVGFEYNDIY